MMYKGIFDTHAHYDDECFDEDRFELLDEMLATAHSDNTKIAVNQFFHTFPQENIYRHIIT